MSVFYLKHRLFPLTVQQSYIHCSLLTVIKTHHNKKWLCCELFYSFLPENKLVSSVLVWARTARRRDKQKCDNTDSETLVPCYTWTQLQLHISKLVILLTYRPNYRPTVCVWKCLKCYKYHFLVKDAHLIRMMPCEKNGTATLDTRRRQRFKICTRRKFQRIELHGAWQKQAHQSSPSSANRRRHPAPGGVCLSPPARRHTSLFE